MRHKIPWVRVTVEVTVIVASILLAFGIEAWWEERRDLRSERLQLIALAEDFSENLELFETRQSRVEGVVRRQLELIEMLRASPSGTEVVIPGAVANALRGVGTIDPVRGTLDAMIGSGRLDQLSDPALRHALTEWPRLVSDVRTDQLESLQYMMHELIPFLASQGDFSQLFDLDAQPIEVRMRSSPALLTMIAGKNVMDQWVVRDVLPLVASTREIHNLLQIEVARWSDGPSGGER